MLLISSEVIILLNKMFTELILVSMAVVCQPQLNCVFLSLWYAIFSGFSWKRESSPDRDSCAYVAKAGATG